MRTPPPTRRRVVTQIFVLSASLALGVSARGEKPPIPIDLDQKSFKVIGYKKGVTVYKHRRASVVRVGAVGRIPVSPERVQRALLDYPRHVGVVARLAEARILSRSKGRLLVYQRLKLPIISDRDFVLEVSHGSDSYKRWVSYHAVRGRGPRPRPGIVRVTLHQGTWELSPIDHGRGSWVRYQFTIDMAGSLPRWIARTGADSELPALFSAICSLSAETASARRRCP